MPSTRSCIKGLALAALTTVVAGSLSYSLAAAELDEVKLGREAAEELEKQYKLVEDEELLEKVNRIGQELVKIAYDIELEPVFGSRTDKRFEFSFKVLNDKDVNALSMPGGFIYINKGLVDYTQSDDELAGVIAHEIAHVVHHHMVALIREQSRMNNQLAIALLAAILTGAPSADLGNVMMGARFIQIAKLNGYSREAERDADMAALAYLSKSKYNPVGMLTFMERLARDEMNRPSINWGVYQTHPYPKERSHEIVSWLQKREIPINRRAVTLGAKAGVFPVEGKEGIYELIMDGRRIVMPASLDESTSQERAQAMAEHINRLMDSGMRLRDIRLDEEGAAISARSELLIQIMPEDAELNAPKTKEVLAREAYDTIYRSLFNQELQKIY